MYSTPVTRTSIRHPLALWACLAAAFLFIAPHKARAVADYSILDIYAEVVFNDFVPNPWDGLGTLSFGDSFRVSLFDSGGDSQGPFGSYSIFDDADNLIYTDYQVQSDLSASGATISGFILTGPVVDLTFSYDLLAGFGSIYLYGYGEVPEFDPELVGSIQRLAFNATPKPDTGETPLPQVPDSGPTLLLGVVGLAACYTVRRYCVPVASE